MKVKQLFECCLFINLTFISRLRKQAIPYFCRQPWASAKLATQWRAGADTHRNGPCRLLSSRVAVKVLRAA